MFSLQGDYCSFPFVGILMVITLISRLFAVLVPMAILWLFNKKLDFKHQLFVWYGGLIRGAIAYAMTFRIDKSVSKQVHIIRQNTLMIVLITTIIFGSLMSLFAKILGISVEKESADVQVFRRFKKSDSVASLDELLIP